MSMPNVPDEFRNDSLNPEISDIPPLQDENLLVHSKVPFGPCFSETFTFFGRYYCRRLFWMTLLAISLGLTLPIYLAHHSFMDAKFIEENSHSLSEQMPGFTNSPIYWITFILAVCGGIFQLMILNWEIKTIRTGNDSWGNLKLQQGFVKTLLKVFLSYICFVLCILGSGLAVLLPVGIIDALAKSGGMGLNPLFLITKLSLVFLGMLFILYQTIRYSFFVPFILDRNARPIQAMNLSSQMMKKNIVTFFLLSLCLLLIIFLITLFIGIFSGFIAWVLDNTLSSPVVHTLLLGILPQALISLIWFPLYTGFMSVFYLMMTGQPRPGVWPKNDEENEKILE